MRRLIKAIVSLRGLAAMAALATTMVLSAPASAQFARAAGIVDISQPEYLSRDLVIFVDGLDLDDAQRVIVESVYDQYVRDFQEGWDGLQDEITAVSKQADRERMNNRDLLSLVLEPFHSWRERRQALGDQFLQNVQLILNQQQLAEWDDFLRRLRREKLMRKGMFSGEDLDLIAVVRDMHLDRAIVDRIEPVLNAYAIDISDALERREAALEARSRDLITMLVDESANEAVEVVKEHVQLRLGIRATNDRYIDEITHALGDVLGPDFRIRALRKGYPSVYQKTQADRMFEVAKTLEAVDQATLKAIVSIEEAYLTRMMDINRQIFDAVRSFEPTAEIARAERYAAHVRNEPTATTGNTTYPLFRERTIIVQDHVLLLKDSMPLEIFAELPGADRYLKKEISDARAAMEAAEREREKKAYSAARQEFYKSKDRVTGAQAVRKMKELQEQKEKQGDN